ncbi:MAG: extracellular solute-binding protein [Nitrospirota bacterium]
MAAKTTAIILAIFLFFYSAGCVQKDKGKNEAVLVFKHGKIAGDPELFRQLLDRFEKENPDIKVNDETLPASTDEQHQFYVINLEGKSSDFDVLSMDVIWVPEFARAGWLRDISHLLALKEREEFFPGHMDAVTYKQLYKDKELIERQPFITCLYDVFMKARPRPVTPYYMMITQVMQPEFSAALSGIKTPEEALNSAHKQIEHIMKVER